MARVFDVQLVIVDHKSIICAGFIAVMHIHACVQEIRFRAILCRIDRKTNEKTKVRPRFIKQDDAAIVRFEVRSTFSLAQLLLPKRHFLLLLLTSKSIKRCTLCFPSGDKRLSVLRVLQGLRSDGSIHSTR